MLMPLILFNIGGVSTLSTFATVEITFDANGGAGAPPKATTSEYSWWTLPSIKPTKSGYTFIGWTSWGTSDTADIAYYSAGDRIWFPEFGHNAYITLVAQWKKNYSPIYVNIPAGKSLKSIYVYINGTWTSHPLKSIYVKNG